MSGNVFNVFLLKYKTYFYVFFYNFEICFYNYGLAGGR